MTPADADSAAANAASGNAVSGLGATAQSEPSAAERAKSLVDGYTHALATNSPRTVGELAEIKALLGIS